MRAATTACLVAFLVAGCFFGGCGPSSDARWIEPGLYDTLLERGATSVPAEMAGSGLPFDAARLNTSWGEMHLHTIDGPALPLEDRTSGRVHEPRGGLRPSLVSPGTEARGTGERPWDDAGGPVVLVQGFDESVDTLRAATAPFLAAMGVERPDSWYATLAAQRWEWGRSVDSGGNETPHYQYWALLDAEPDLERLVSSLGSDNATRQAAVFIEDVRMAWEDQDWRMSFKADVVRHTLDAEPPLELVVNSADGVHVEMPDAYDDNETGGRAWIAEAFRSNGLGTPRMAELQWSTMIC